MEFITKVGRGEETLSLKGLTERTLMNDYTALGISAFPS